MGYGEGYRYAHDEPQGTADLECLPASLKDRRYVDLGSGGGEEPIANALKEWARRRLAARGEKS